MPLRIQPPRGELKFWSALWILAGIVGAIWFAASGERGLLVAIPVALLAVGMWLRIKWAGIVLLVLLGITTILAIALLLFLEGFTWLRALRIVAAGYYAWLIFDWVREFDEIEDLYYIESAKELR